LRFLRSRQKSLLTDNEIIRQYRSEQDPALIGVLFERYSHLIYAVSFNYLKDEDECKDAVIQIFENLGRDLLKYNIQYFSSWLHTVTRNHCLKILSSKKDFVPLQEAYHLNPEEETDDSEFYKYLPHLSEAIQNLNKDQRQCVELFYLKELSYKDISDQTGYNLNQVKSFIQNGKRNLKIILEKRKK
jgi:RNA polymerase sigma-70 factor (ECF subfamily)